MPSLSEALAKTNVEFEDLPSDQIETYPTPSGSWRGRAASHPMKSFQSVCSGMSG